MSKTPNKTDAARKLRREEQAEKLRVVKEMVAAGLDDVRNGRVSEWNFDEFLREARRLEQARK